MRLPPGHHEVPLSGHVGRAPTGAGHAGFFGTNVSRKGNGDFEVNEDEAVKIIALAYYPRDVQAFPDEWDQMRMLHGDADGDIKRCFDIIRLAVFNINEDKGNLLCPTYFSLRQ